MASRQLGTASVAHTADVRVAHDPRDSYSRSVIPCAKRNMARLGLWPGWTGYEVSVVDTDETTDAGEVVSIVRFVRTR
jgi:hypothetical protein